MRSWARTAVTILAAASCAIATAEEDRLEIEDVPFGERVTMPWPTSRDGKVSLWIARRPGFALLQLSPLPFGDGVLAPTEGYIAVQELRGIRGVEDAKTHFRLVHGIDLDAAERESGRKLEVRPVALGEVLIVDTSKLGSIPGNTYYYWFAARRDAGERKTIMIGPTWKVSFDLDGLRRV